MGRGAEYVHGADGDSLGVGREEALAATRDGREQPEGLVTARGVGHERRRTRGKRMHLHDSLEVVHVAVVLRAKRVLAGGVEPVDLLLEPRVRLRVGQQAVEETRHRAGRGVGAGDDGEHAVVIELACGRRRPVREIFIVLLSVSVRVFS